MFELLFLWLKMMSLRDPPPHNLLFVVRPLIMCRTVFGDGSQWDGSSDISFPNG